MRRELRRVPVLCKSLRAGAKSPRFWMAGFFVTLVGASITLYWQGRLTPADILFIFRSRPILTPVVFFVIYAVMVVTLLPTLPLNMAAGALWGPFFGSILSIAAATTGASVAFLTSRYLFGGVFGSSFDGRLWSWLNSEIVSAGWKAVAFVRVNPAFPFGPTSYFLGVTGIQFSRYFWATLIFTAPPSILMAAMGDAIGGIALRGNAADWMRNVFLISVSFTALVGIRYWLRFWARGGSMATPSDRTNGRDAL